MRSRFVQDDKRVAVTRETLLLYFLQMPIKLSPEAARQLASRVNYFRDMGIYDFYRRTDTAVLDDLLAASKSALPEAAPSEVAAETKVETAPSAIAQNLAVDSPMPTIRSKA